MPISNTNKAPLQAYPWPVMLAMQLGVIPERCELIEVVDTTTHPENVYAIASTWSGRWLLSTEAWPESSSVVQTIFANIDSLDVQVIEETSDHDPNYTYTALVIHVQNLVFEDDHVEDEEEDEEEDQGSENSESSGFVDFVAEETDVHDMSVQ